MNYWYKGFDLIIDICICGKPAGDHNGATAACPDTKTVWSATNFFTLHIRDGKKVAGSSSMVKVAKSSTKKYIDECPCGIHPSKCDYHKEV
jgi:hypothetical protein